mmetsp:Transcript_1799/g.3865  ORF Transcript_1799/g.3865 Transcript_1799/m.3865 type:complete len:175 (+) Transcript_1799:22-546(+)
MEKPMTVGDSMDHGKKFRKGCHFIFLACAAVTVAATLYFQINSSTHISMIKNMPCPSALKPLIMANDNVTVEDLMYKYKSDKSRDDHGYSKLYNMLFSTLRNSVTNMTEVGIAAGQSVQAWYRYFPNAEIHAFDVHWLSDNVKVNMDMLKPRVQAHIVNILGEGWEHGRIRIYT